MKLQKIIKNNLTVFVLLLILILSFISISVSSGKFDVKIRVAGSSIFTLLQSGTNKVSTFFTGTVTSMSELRQLRIKYDNLQNKIANYQMMQRNIIQLELENKRLRQQLGLTREIPEHFITAEVIAQEPGSLFKTMVIDKGFSQGIKKNMPVIAFQNGIKGLVGRIVEVTRYTSKILPVFSRDSYVGARMLKNRYEGLINGEGSKYGFILMNYVKKGAINKIKFDDTVVTSGINSLFPGGIFIGRVREIDTSKWQPSLQLKLEPVIDFSRLEYVYVLTGGKSEKI